jgi:hypothetical protein
MIFEFWLKIENLLKTFSLVQNGILCFPGWACLEIEFFGRSCVLDGPAYEPTHGAQLLCCLKQRICIPDQRSKRQKKLLKRF